MLETEPIHVDEPQPPQNLTAATAAPAGLAQKVRSIDGVTAAVAMLVLVAGGGLYTMNARTSAAALHMAQVDASATDVDTLLAGGREGIAALNRSVRATRDLVARLANHRSIDGENVQLASAVRLGGEGAAPAVRDPFAFKPADLSPATPTPSADEQPDREQLRAESLAAARQLQVQSIIHGASRRACLINGKLFFEGQPVDDRFSVQSIAPDGVVVRDGDFRFELRLRK